MHLTRKTVKIEQRKREVCNLSHGSCCETIPGTKLIHCAKIVIESSSAEKNICSFKVPYEEFMENDHESFQESLRLSVELFNELLDGIEPVIARQVCLGVKNDKLQSIYLLCICRLR